MLTSERKQTVRKVVEITKQSMTALLNALTSPYFTAGKVLILCMLLTSIHTTTLLDYGFSSVNWYNFFTWHFVHRSYSHNLWNCVILFGFIGAPIACSFLDLLVISAFVWCVSLYDPFLFYGASGIIFFFLGRIVNAKYLTKTYNFLHLPIQFPYYSLVLYCIIAFMTLNIMALRASDLLHVFCFFYGFMYECTILSNYLSKTFSRVCSSVKERMSDVSLHQMMFRQTNFQDITQ